MGFHSMAVVGKLVKRKKERDSYIQEEKQYTKQYKNREYTKLKTHKEQENNLTKIIKKYIQGVS